MGFTVVEQEIRPVWVPVDGTSTVYEGSIVKMGLLTPADSGCVAIGAASGASNTTGKTVPFGVVIGTNNWTTVNDSTYGAKLVGVNTAAAQLARDWRGAEGMLYPKGDPQPLALVALITPSTVLKGPIFNTSYGTAPSVTTAASGLSTTGFTNSATCGFTPVAYNATHQWRTGTNAGIARIGSDTSTTVHTVVKAYPYTPVAGDTCVSVNIRQGTCRAQLDATSTFIDTAAALTSDYYTIRVLDMNLDEAGNEYAIFMFDGDNFTSNRA